MRNVQVYHCRLWHCICHYKSVYLDKVFSEALYGERLVSHYRPVNEAKSQPIFEAWQLESVAVTKEWHFFAGRLWTKGVKLPKTLDRWSMRNRISEILGSYMENRE